MSAHAIEEIVSMLRTAREARGLSQRDLGLKVGLPQSHISRIESGGSDIRLSSLIELARALDLELTLIPRRTLPAVQGILRSSEPALPFDARLMPQELNRAEKVLSDLSAAHADAPALDAVRRLLLDLKSLPLSRTDLTVIRNAVDHLKAARTRAGKLAILPSLAGELNAMRNRIAHGIPQGPKPAYSLDEDEDA